MDPVRKAEQQIKHPTGADLRNALALAATLAAKQHKPGDRFTVHAFGVPATFRLDERGRVEHAPTRAERRRDERWRS